MTNPPSKAECDAALEYLREQCGKIVTIGTVHRRIAHLESEVKRLRELVSGAIPWIDGVAGGFGVLERQGSFPVKWLSDARAALKECTPDPDKGPPDPLQEVKDGKA